MNHGYLTQASETNSFLLIKMCLAENYDFKPLESQCGFE